MMTFAEPTPATATVEKVYRIGELASEFDVTLRTLRFYEDKGLLQPRRIGSTRLYSRRDRARLKLILLGKRVGFPLQDIREMLALYEPGGNNLRQLEVAEEMGVEQLDRLHRERAGLDAAIEELTQTLDLVRQTITERRRA